MKSHNRSTARNRTNSHNDSTLCGLVVPNIKSNAPLPIPALTDEQQARFWAKITVGDPDECWPWNGATTTGVRGGEPYGVWQVDGRNLRPPRVARTLLIGPIPEGLTLDHVKERCTNTLCCNPNHTEPVTQSVNSMRRNGATETMCGNGHPREAGTKCAICRKAAWQRFSDKDRPNRIAKYRAAHPKPENPTALYAQKLNESERPSL